MSLTRKWGGVLVLLWLPVIFAASPEPPQAAHSPRILSAMDFMAWGLGLVVVLLVFFLCIWGLRKLGGFAATHGERMYLAGGLSLGMRERVVLLQVGRKQLVLGVTPGRIQTLMVLEGDDCLQNAGTLANAGVSGSAFANKLAQVLKSRNSQNQTDLTDA